MVAELAALGKAKPWAYQAANSWEEELAYWVEEMVAQRQMLMPWQGRLEGLLARHWPEASQVLKLSSGTLLRILKRYGSPQALAEDADAATQLARWGRSLLSAAKIEELLTGARSSVGVRPGPWQQRQIQEYAEQALAARQRANRRNGGCVNWPRGIRCSRRRARWWVCRRRVSCGPARVTRGTLIRRGPTARRWG